jgi:nicotinic acid mononucleotide adenylyltransferase
MISNCLKFTTGSKSRKVDRIEYPSAEVKGEDTSRVESENIEKANLVPANVLSDKNKVIDIKRSLAESSPSELGIQLGALSAGNVRTVKEARMFRENYKISAINLALFPSSCAPPTLAHEMIMCNVLNLPFVDQVWVDVNYKSYTKKGLEDMFNERLEMVKLAVADKPGLDYCTLSKDTKVGEEKGDEADTYFAVARALVGTGMLSWVVGGDVVKNMVYWKERAKVNLLQVDKLIICTRGIPKDEIQNDLLAVIGNKEELDLFLQRVYYIHTTADISSTAAREGLHKMLSVMSPKILTYIITQSHVLEQYSNEFRPTSY